MNNIAENVAPNRIKEMREAQGLSQEALGKKMGVSKMQVSKLERGKVALTLSTMRRASAALQCYPSDLLADTDRRPTDAGYGKVDQELLKMVVEEALNWREGVVNYMQTHGYNMGPHLLAKAIAQAYNRVSSERSNRDEAVPKEIDTLLAFLAEG